MKFCESKKSTTASCMFSSNLATEDQAAEWVDLYGERLYNNLSLFPFLLRLFHPDTFSTGQSFHPDTFPTQTLCDTGTHCHLGTSKEERDAAIPPA